MPIIFIQVSGGWVGFGFFGPQRILLDKFPLISFGIVDKMLTEIQSFIALTILNVFTVDFTFALFLKLVIS